MRENFFSNNELVLICGTTIILQLILRYYFFIKIICNLPAGDHKFAITKIPKLIFSIAQYKYTLEIPFEQLHKIGPWTDILTCHIKSIL